MLFNSLRKSRFWTLIIKEIQQIIGNKQIILLLIFPPTIQLLVYGLALDANVSDLSFGVTDYSNSRESRELVSAFTETKIFSIKSTPRNTEEMESQINTRLITVGLIIPPNFNRNLLTEKISELQIIINGIDANTAGIVKSYIKQIINQYNQRLNNQKLGYDTAKELIQTQFRFMYNPGLISSWFFMPGVIGIILTLTGSFVSSITLIQEKNAGTLEQILMTPSAEWEILAAKITPLFIFLMGDVILAISLSCLVFRLPFRGSFGLFLLLSAVYLFTCIGIGLLIATLFRTQQQVILTTFFFNIPMIQLSGAVAPTESMPYVFQIISFCDPLRHYVLINRCIILKGTGLKEILPNAFFLLLFTSILLIVSIKKFRSQLS